MSHIYTSADQLIGRTPLLELTHLEKKYGCHFRGRVKSRQDGVLDPVHVALVFPFVGGVRPDVKIMISRRFFWDWKKCIKIVKNRVDIVEKSEKI